MDLAQCRISYRHVSKRLADGAVVIRNDPGGDGEVWQDGRLLLVLRSELMAIYEAALLREFLREESDAGWILVDADAV